MDESVFYLDIIQLAISKTSIEDDDGGQACIRMRLARKHRRTLSSAQTVHNPVKRKPRPSSC